MTTIVTLIAPLAVLPTLNGLCFALAGTAAGESMFQPNVNEAGPADKTTATHAVLNGAISQEMYDLMQDPAGIVEKSKGAITLPQITGLLAACDISQDSIGVALDRVYGRVHLELT